MRSQNRKVKIIGRASCLGLLMLLVLATCPVVPTSAFAEEVLEDETSVPAVQADTPSTMGISFSPAVGSTTLSPTTSAGQSAQINVLATVSVENSDGYTVYLKGSDTNLVGKQSTSNIIPGTTTAKTYVNMDVNTWGYYAGEGTAVPTDASYKSVSVSGNGDKIAENTAKKIISDTKRIMLSFAAKVNDSMPADTYENTITMSVVSSPLQTTLTDIANMQDMTSAICAASANYETKQLKDTRDGKFYWVTKLGDGKCWMTQNLDLDLSTGTKLTADTSDVPEAGWTPGYTTATTATSSTVNVSVTGQNSWSLGSYRVTKPNTSNDCGYPKNDASQCPEQFTAYTTPTTENKDELAHYILGNHYQWNTATAGTGGTITEGQATNSICAKGWRLPTGDTGGEFEKLVAALGGASSVDNVTEAPFYGVRGGVVNQGAYLFTFAGNTGDYWSSTPVTNGGQAYRLFFEDAVVTPTAGDNTRNNGFSVRCIAR